MIRRMTTKLQAQKPPMDNSVLIHRNNQINSIFNFFRVSYPFVLFICRLDVLDLKSFSGRTCDSAFRFCKKIFHYFLELDKHELPCEFHFNNCFLILAVRCRGIAQRNTDRHDLCFCNTAYHGLRFYHAACDHIVNLSNYFLLLFNSKNFYFRLVANRRRSTQIMSPVRLRNKI